MSTKTTKQKPEEQLAIPVVYVVQSVPLKRVGDLLCSAFEGGSNYWYMIEKFNNPVGNPESWAFRLDKGQIFRHVDYPLNEGGSLIVSDAKEATGDDVRKVRLNLKSIKKGLAVMAQKYPRHFGNFMQENDDAETGDVFLQCCLFGELVYEMSKSPIKKKRTTAIERHTVITLSTAHVPESLATPDEVAARAAIMDRLALMTGEHGWLVNVNRDLSTVKEPESIVDALREILWWAKKRGADYVLFDADGPVIERFCTYDW